MARAKRLNAEKVTISMDSDVLLSAKHKALDLKLTLSDYIQGLVNRDIQPVVELSPEPIVEPVIEPKIELGMNMFVADLGNKELVVAEVATEERIKELWKLNEGMKRGRNHFIAETLNSCNQLNSKGELWTMASVKAEIDRLRKQENRRSVKSSPQVDATSPT